MMYDENDPEGLNDQEPDAPGDLQGIGRRNDQRVQAKPDQWGIEAAARPPTQPSQPASLTPAATAAGGATGAGMAGYGPSGTPSAAPAAGAAGAAGGASAMPWVGAIAGELAKHQQEQAMRREAAANIGAQFGRSQGNFPQYDIQAAQMNNRINTGLGGTGINLGSLLRRR